MPSAIVSFLDDRPSFSAGLLIISLTALAWMNRFIQDDAFISFRYARNAVQGIGLVWNEGQRVEGYTNFLWTVLMMVPHYLHIDPVLFSQLAGLLFFVLTLMFTYKTSCLLMANHRFALLAVAFVGTNFTFSSYATGGLETQMQASLIVVSMYMVLAHLRSVDWPIENIATFSLVTAVSILTRLDSALIAMVSFPLALAVILRGETTSYRKISQILGLIVPVLVLVGVWMLWKQFYYGSLIPNTFYAKVSVESSFPEGMRFVSKFFISYWLWPFAILLPFASRKLCDESNLGILALLAAVLVWLTYVMAIGGGFMEFRFMVLAWPLLAIVLVWLLATVTTRKAIRWFFVGLAFCGSLYHAVTFNYSMGIESISGLTSHVCGTPVNWIDVGKTLAKFFNEDQEVTIATTASGAIPYYSRLKTLDMLGLADPWIAKHGLRIAPQPGHKRLATLDYMVASKVNLAIGHPLIINRIGTQLPQYHLKHLQHVAPILQRDHLPDNSCVVEIPINERYSLVALYLVPSPVVDKVIAKNSWRRVPIAKNVQRQEGLN